MSFEAFKPGQNDREEIVDSSGRDFLLCPAFSERFLRQAELAILGCDLKELAGTHLQQR